MGKGDEPDDGEAVEGAAGAAGVVDKEVMVMLQFTSRRCFLSSHVSTKIYPLLYVSRKLCELQQDRLLDIFTALAG